MKKLWETLNKVWQRVTSRCSVFRLNPKRQSFWVVIIRISWHVNVPHVVLDVGANIGTFSIPMARRIMDRGEVIAFEPQQTVFYQLCGNIVLNRLSNVNAYNLAVADKSGTLQLPETNFHDNLNNGGLSFEPIYNLHNGIAVKGGMKKES